jgi:hypothetical protein
MVMYAVRLADTHIVRTRAFSCARSRMQLA